MRRQKKSLASPYTDNDGNPRELSPAESLVLSAFTDSGDQFHDHWTIGSWLNGSRCYPKKARRACESLAAAVLADLEKMGHVTRDRNGWHRLADQPAAAAPQTAPEGEP